MSSYTSYRTFLFSLLFILQPLLLILIILDIRGGSLTIPRMILTVIYISFASGFPLAILLRLDNTNPLNFLLYTLGLSFAFIMGIGLVMNLIYPSLGIEKPMTIFPLVSTIYLVISVYSISVGFFRSDIGITNNISVHNLFNSLPLALLNLPFLSILGIIVHNRTGNELLIFLLFIILPIIPPLFLFFDINERWYSLTIFVSSLSVLYPHTLWKNSYPQESWMPVVTPDLGYWSLILGTGAEQEGILPESLLYPVFSIIGGISPVTQLEVVNPLIISITPVAVFVIYRRYLPSQSAFIGSLLVVFIHNYYFDRWGFGTRDSIAVMFVVLFIAIVFDENVRHRSRKIASSIFLVCAIVSHWGVAFILIGVLTVMSLLPLFERIVTTINLSKKRRFPLSLLLLAYMITFSWWTFTGEAEKVGQLVSNVSTLFLDLTFSNPSAGPSSRALQMEVPFSTRLLRIIYVILTWLMGVGVLHALVRRVQGAPRVINDEYLILSISFLGVLGATFLPIGAFYGTERILSLVYPITGLFAIFGLQWIEKSIKSHISYQTTRSISKDRAITVSLYAFSILLILIFLLGTGAVAELSSSDYGQSLILSNDDLKSSDDPELQWVAADCYECDGQALVWLATNYHSDYETASDYEHNWARYYGFTLAAETSISPWEFLSEDYPLLRQNQEDLQNLSDENSDDMYIYLHSKNNRTGSYRVGQWDQELESLKTVSKQLEESNKIYVNDNSTVYLK